jgi:hypothetical protein
MNKVLIPVSIIIAGLLIAGALVYINQGKVEEKVSQGLSSQQAAEKAINYINENLLQKGTTASLVNVTEENGLYKFRLKIGEQEFVSYVTKDGKILFPQEGIDLEKKLTKEGTPSEETPKTCEDIKKLDSPSLEAFVVSQCPYGLQMQRVLNEIVKNIPSLAENIKVKYIGAIEGNKITSMHGDEEAQENLRQICIREEQGDKYWNYINCHIKKGEVENCLTTAGIEKEKLTSCMTDNSKGLKYAKEDFDAQEKYKVTGSPTLILNEERVSEFDFGGRTAQAVKTLICCGFKSVPGNCSQKLTEDSADTGFSETYSQSSGSSGGSCK